MKPAALLVSKHEDTTGASGNGRQALLDLVGKYNKVTDDLIRSTMDKLVDSTMQLGQDPHEFFVEKTLARAELEKMGEPISDRRFKDIFVQGFTAEYKDIKLMMYRDPTFDIDQMQSTMGHLYLDDISRSNGANEKIAGGGVAMATETSTCSHCERDGHHTRTCRKKRNGDKKSSGKKGTTAN